MSDVSLSAMQRRRRRLSVLFFLPTASPAAAEPAAPEVASAFAASSRAALPAQPASTPGSSEDAAVRALHGCDFLLCNSVRSDADLYTPMPPRRGPIKGY